MDGYTGLGFGLAVSLSAVALVKLLCGRKRTRADGVNVDGTVGTGPGITAATSVHFDRATELTTIGFANGTSFSFPTRSLEGLKAATADQLAEVELLGASGLHWESLDADFSIRGLLNGVFGTKSFMDARRVD